MPIEVVHWNPRRPVMKGLLGKLVPIRRPVNNFGDLLGPEIVHRIARMRFAAADMACARGRLLAVGSILSLARPGDTVWGIGVNGKSLDKAYALSEISFRAVRGPLTRAFVGRNGGQCPEIFGDPGLLVPQLWTEEELAGPTHEVTIVPNLNDLRLYNLEDERILLPTAPLSECLSRIRHSRFVTGSSLHGIIVAEAFGIPARLITSGAEPEFKYNDYYLGSGRSGFKSARNVQEAIEMGGEPPIDWDPSPLMSAFPADLWKTAA